MEIEMKRQILPVVLAAIGQYATTANAETVLKANMPFAFRVGSVELAPGAYKIVAEGTRLVLRNKDGENLAVVWGTRGDGNATNRLVFSVVGDRYFLANIHCGEEVVQLPVTSDEKRLRESGEKPRVAFVLLGR